MKKLSGRIIQMKILDANMILRYLTTDNKEMADYVENILINEKVLVFPEVIAEVIYVMKCVYKYERIQIAEGIIEFMSIPNVLSNCGSVINKALETFRDNNLDFVDCVLYAYYKELGYEFCTFDKKLKELIKNK